MIFNLTALLWVLNNPTHGFLLPGILILALVKLLKISVYLLMAAVFAQAILSWVHPYTPIAPLLTAVTGRFLRPLRRIVPMLGNVDLSSLLLLIICQLILIVPISALEQIALGLF